ncbi:non-ribosomal peptide synthetase [Burkholderia pseudomallei]|nr:non-ribosomal peptide synthetase [Burkholderia pseudomallei]
MLDEAERKQVVYAWNATERDYPIEQCIHQLFEAQVDRKPEAIALTFEGQRLSYAELNARANRLAHYLQARGVGPGRLVALCAERGIEMVVGLLAILKAGGAYVPLDPAYASDRLRGIVEDSQPALVLADAVGRAALGELDGALPVIDLETDALRWREMPATNPEVASQHVHHLAYVIYTSGSTGRPKGVMVEHAQVVRLFGATQAWFGFDERDVWTLFHSHGFDFSVWELWGALLHGGRLVIVPTEVTRTPSAFFALLCAEGVTVLNQTPSAFQALMSAQEEREEAAGNIERANVVAHRLRYVIFGGEALEPRTLASWYARHGERTQLVNMYGITETTVHVTYCALRAEDAMRLGASPIGVRIPDLQLYVLDDRREPVPMGVTGELYVGGAGVARGYLNRPELTRERFIDDPFVAGGRLYKTGDLARWRTDGSLEYLGRNDFQVKIRGFRIELGEIEAQLAKVAGVREVVVLARRLRLLGMGVVGRAAARWSAGDRADGGNAHAVGVLCAAVRGRRDGAESDAERVPGADVGAGGAGRGGVKGGCRRGSGGGREYRARKRSRPPAALCHLRWRGAGAADARVVVCPSRRAYAVGEHVWNHRDDGARDVLCAASGRRHAFGCESDRRADSGFAAVRAG